MSLRPIVSKGYSQTRGSNIWRTEVQGGVPRQGRDTYFEPVPISVTLVVSSLGRQAFYSFLNNIDGGASSFIMPHDTGLGIEDHQVLITSDISDSTDDGKNWVITFTATAERTAIQEDTCLTKNLPDLFGCYGDCLGGFLKAYGTAQSTFPRIWSNEGSAGYPPINLLASALDSRIVYNGRQVYYINRNGFLVQSSGEWPLTFIDGVAVGRVPPENTSKNEILHNADLTNSAWVTTRISVTAAQQTEMLGNNCFKLTPTTNNSSHCVGQSPALKILEGGVCTFSVMAKADGYKNLRLRIANGNVFISDATIDLIEGVLIGGAGNSSVENLGQGWFRVSESVTAPAGGYNAINMQLWVHDDSNSKAFAGDGVKGVLVCAPQSDSIGRPTSPIITGPSPVTRYTATAKVAMNGATSIDITYSDSSVVNVQAVDGYASIPRADSAWGSKYITRIDFNVGG